DGQRLEVEVVHRTALLLGRDGVSGSAERRLAVHHRVADSVRSGEEARRVRLDLRGQIENTLLRPAWDDNQVLQWAALRVEGELPLVLGIRQGLEGLWQILLLDLIRAIDAVVHHVAHGGHAVLELRHLDVIHRILQGRKLATEHLHPRIGVGHELALLQVERDVVAGLQQVRAGLSTTRFRDQPRGGNTGLQIRTCDLDVRTKALVEGLLPGSLNVGTPGPQLNRALLLGRRQHLREGRDVALGGGRCAGRGGRRGRPTAGSQQQGRGRHQLEEETPANAGRLFNHGNCRLHSCSYTYDYNSSTRAKFHPPPRGAWPASPWPRNQAIVAGSPSAQPAE